jgi:hypothetical protein
LLALAAACHGSSHSVWCLSAACATWHHCCRCWRWGCGVVQLQPLPGWHVCCDVSGWRQLRARARQLVLDQLPLPACGAQDQHDPCVCAQDSVARVCTDSCAGGRRPRAPPPPRSCSCAAARLPPRAAACVCAHRGEHSGARHGRCATAHRPAGAA